MMGQALGYDQGWSMLEEVRIAVRRQEHRYTLHAQERMARRRITDQEVVQVISCAEVDKEGIVRGKWIGEDMAVFPNEPLLKAARELSGG